MNIEFEIRNNSHNKAIFDIDRFQVDESKRLIIVQLKDGGRKVTLDLEDDDFDILHEMIGAHDPKSSDTRWVYWEKSKMMTVVRSQLNNANIDNYTLNFRLGKQQEPFSSRFGVMLGSKSGISHSVSDQRDVRLFSGLLGMLSNL